MSLASLNRFERVFDRVALPVFVALGAALVVAVLAVGL